MDASGEVPRDARAAHGDRTTSSSTALATLGLVMALGILAIAAYAARTRVGVSPWSILGVGVALAGAAALGGGLLGFLFGIPRAAANASSAAAYRANTNLEDISDWLTKILVGVGLTQVAAFPSWLRGVAGFFAPGLGGTPASATLATAILLLFMVCGFLFAYLWTRLFLAGALAQADRRALEAIESKTATLEKKVDDFQKQQDDDTRALLLVEKQLSLPPGQPDLSQADLDAAVGAASPSARVQIFNRAHTTRATSWRDPAAKQAMERTIPVFRALVAADPEGRYHTNLGQLGFALKDQRQPDWAEALAVLDKAIGARGPWQDRGWTYYEFNRAVCRMMTDPAFLQDRPSAAPVREAILDDLGAAAATGLLPVLRKVDEVGRWLHVNGMGYEDLDRHSGEGRAAR